MMWHEGTLAFDHSVIAVASTEWLVYFWDSLAPREISFIIVASAFTLRGLFSYQIISDSLAFDNGLLLWVEFLHVFGQAPVRIANLSC